MLAVIYEYPKEREWLGRLFARHPELFGRLAFQVIAGRPGLVAAYGAGYGGRTAGPAEDTPVDWELVAATTALALELGDADTRATALGFYDQARNRQAALAARPAAYDAGRDD